MCENDKMSLMGKGPQPLGDIPPWVVQKKNILKISCIDMKERM